MAYPLFLNWGYRSVKTHTSRFRGSFIPAVIRQLNHPTTTREQCWTTNYLIDDPRTILDWTSEEGSRPETSPIPSLQRCCLSRWVTPTFCVYLWFKPASAVLSYTTSTIGTAKVERSRDYHPSLLTIDPGCFQNYIQNFQLHLCCPLCSSYLPHT